MQILICKPGLRQWRRLTAANGDELTYRQIVDCLGWHGLENDAGVVQCLTDRLLRSVAEKATVPLDAWYVSRGGVHWWRWPVCLAAMRLAAVYVGRLRLGGADLAFVVRDVRQHAKA